MEIRNIKDMMIPVDKLAHPGKQTAKLAKGVLFREDTDEYGRSIFTKVSENTVVLGGAIAALERLTGLESSFRPKTVNELLNIYPEGSQNTAYNIANTTIALFGCGIGGATMTFGEVYDPKVSQRNVYQMVPMRVADYSSDEPSDDDNRYFMETTVKVSAEGGVDGTLASDGTGTDLRCWYLKEFAETPVIHSLLKNGTSEEDDGTEIESDEEYIGEDTPDSEMETGVEAFVQFKLVLNDKDVRSFFQAAGETSQARINTIGLYLGQKVYKEGYGPENENDEDGTPGYDYDNVSLFSVVNLDNEALAERKTVSYFYRIYAMI